MPNWCENLLEVRSPYNRDYLDKFIDDNKSNDEIVNELGRKDTPVLSFERNVPLDPFADPYYEAIEKWGVKWDASMTSMEDNYHTLEYHFFTAWSIPDNWFEKIVALYPNLSFTLRWSEPGMDSAGYLLGGNGRVYSKTELTSDAAIDENIEDRASVYNIRVPYLS